MKKLLLGLVVGTCLTVGWGSSLAAAAPADRPSLKNQVARQEVQANQEVAATYDDGQTVEQDTLNVQQLERLKKIKATLETDLQQTLENEKKFQMTLFLGMVNYRLNLYDEAGKCFDKAVALKPESVLARIEKIMILSKQTPSSAEQAKIILPELDQIIQYHPDGLLYYFWRIEENQKIKAYEPIIKDFTTLLTLADKPELQASLYNGRGLNYCQVKNYQAAEADFKQAMALTKVSSNLNDYKNNLAMTYKYLGKYEQALEEINEALKAEPDQANALDTKGDILVCLGRYAEAVPFFDKAISQRPEEGEIYYNRARAYEGLKKTELALADYQKAIELEGEHQKEAAAKVEELKQKKAEVKADEPKQKEPSVKADGLKTHEETAKAELKQKETAAKTEETKSK